MIKTWIINVYHGIIGNKWSIFILIGLLIWGFLYLNYRYRKYKEYKIQTDPLYRRGYLKALQFEYISGRINECTLYEEYLRISEIEQLYERKIKNNERLKNLSNEINEEIIHEEIIGEKPNKIKLITKEIY